MAASPRERPDGRQARWDRHNRARRRDIVDASLEVIEAAGVGVEVHVQQIADRASLSRTVVYRHFADRTDLDLAVQRRIFEDLGVVLMPAMSFEGTPLEIIRRISAAYIGWAAGHPALHRFAEREIAGSDESPMDEAVAVIAQTIGTMINDVVEALGASLTDDDRAGLEPLVFGIVGLGFGAVRRWLQRPEREPATDVFVEQVTEAVWHQIGGLAARRGVQIDPDRPLDELFADVGTPSAADDAADADAVADGDTAGEVTPA